MKTTASTIGTAAKLVWSALLGGAIAAAPVHAQVRSVDPDQAIDGDLSAQRSGPQSSAATTPRASAPAQTAASQQDPGLTQDPAPAQDPGAAPGSADAASPGYAAPSDAGAAAAEPASAHRAASAAAGGRGDTYHEDDLIGAAQGVFGKGAKGLAQLIQDILKKQGEPNGYIVGREGGGAFVFGLRYGSGTLYHKVEGERPVYWTGPSVGFDGGANAGNAFVLVYNLYDTEDLYKRFVAGEGQAYLVGGFNVSYLRAGDVVLVPVRMGVGLRLGANIGYMKFSHKQNWVPF